MKSGAGVKQPGVLAGSSSVNWGWQVGRHRSLWPRRIGSTWEGANIKLGDVLADVLGKSGHAMLQALAAGDYDPQELAAQARYGLQKKRERLGQALIGSVGLTSATCSLATPAHRVPGAADPGAGPGGRGTDAPF